MGWWWWQAYDWNEAPTCTHLRDAITGADLRAFRKAAKLTQADLASCAGGECRNKSEPGKRRCKLHGGKSTGAKTPEGLARIAAAQVRRWAAYRTEEAGKAP
ncbi:HGGxSTG domain-containing protein [Tabrizicola oligotrophica]|uniref:HGGxSTG domain-containing protein n=1 Tax=Tabrizicola oligotrophica TaxID=2710650 RepID=UPI002AB1B3BF|nr:HGGxSTG domain-containing protein [Tabrizicola oligotrophica]